MNPGHVLAWLGGAQPRILAETPADAPKYNAMGAVLLGTAAVASLSAAFALNTAVHLPIAFAFVVGGMWGLLILSLDRMLVVTMGRQSGFWRGFAAAVPRLVLALLIGAVISIPLVLRIFEPEINSELQVMHSENLTANQQKLAAQYADIKPLQQKVDQLQAAADGQSQPSVSSDPDVAAARAAVATAQAAYDKAAADAQCELVGRCGTNRPGPGPAYQSAKAVADRALDTLNAAKAKLKDVEAAATRRIDGGAAASQASAAADLKILRPQLERRIKERDAAQQRLDSTETSNDGLLARLEALDRLSADRTTMRLAHWALILLFACIELLPVIAKLLSSAGPPTLYELLVDRREKDVLANDQLWSDQQEAITRGRIQVHQALEDDRNAQLLEIGKVANVRLAETKLELARQALDVWAQVASRRTDEELRRWYALHAGLPAPQPPPTLPIPTQPNGPGSINGRGGSSDPISPAPAVGP